jgi:murein L,D-transpeptidase YcbB/YkuD
MTAERIFPVLVMLGLLALPASAAESPSAAVQSASSAQADATDQPGDQPGTAAEPSSEAGLVPEIAERLAAGGSNLSTADREDRAALAKFYASRQQQPVWVGATGLTPAGQAVSAEIRRADDWGLEASAFRLPASGGSGLSPTARVDAEIAVSLAVLKYARHARGSRADPATLSKFLDRAPPLLDPSQVIAAAAKAENPDAFLRFLHPRHPQFEALRQKYLALKSGRAIAPAKTAAADDKKAGQTGAATVPQLTGAKKLLVNMEEWRWMPEQLGDFYVWVNIPEFTLRVVKGGQVIHTERVVIGKRDTPTPVFSQNLEQVIFHPNWGVPESIKKQDVLPSLIRGSTRIFTFYHLRIQRGGRDIDPSTVDWSTADMRNFHVYQPPGENNVLGNIKFRFPNKHDVYMHDTPQKNLFNADVRAFSHGCMRVRNPERLAALLLAEDQGWPANRTAAAIGPGGAQNNQIKIGHKIPVHITYFTASVGDDGKLKLFQDIYDHESKIVLGLAGKAHLIPRWKEDKAPTQAEAIGSLAESTSTNTNDGFGKKDWARKAMGTFGNF